MKLVNKFSNLVTSFNQDTKGSILTATAVLVPVLFMSAGFAFDYTRMTSTKNKLDNALDAAVLFAGNNLSKGMPVDEEFEKQFNDAFHANFVGRAGFVPEYQILNFSADEDTGEITASVETEVKATVSRIFGFEELPVSSSSTAIFTQTDTEIAMMLDATGSMDGDKIVALKNAATSAIKILLEGNKKKTTRVGLVPYSSSVNAGKWADDVTSGNSQFASANGNFTDFRLNVPTTKCVTERDGRDRATDVSYRNSPLGSNRRAGTKCPDVEILPLTNRKGVLKRRIRAMSASGATAGHLGIAWSYYMLSEKWRKLWPTSADPAPYSKDVKKVAILMTDGSFNTFYEGSGSSVEISNALAHELARDRSNELARELCSDMKAVKNGNPGITVYSVAFAAPADAQKLLRDCANDDTATETFYYSADNGSELETAFVAIANSIQKLRLTR